MVNYFARTATRDVEIGGQQIAAGEKVVMWYTSASRDEEGAEDPQRFDIHSLTAMPVRFTPGAREAG